MELDRSRRASLAWRVIAAVLVLASLAHFALELRLILSNCCYDFPDAFERLLGFATEGRPVYTRKLALYAPGVGPFKYPPLYALFIWLGIEAGLRQTPLVPYLALQVALYILAAAVLARVFAIPRGGLAMLYIMLVLSFGPAFETLLRLQIEMPVLLCLSLAALALQRRRAGLAGWLLAAATMLKLYPAMALAACVPRSLRALATFVAGIATFLLLSVWVFGRADCETFFLRALPLMMRELPVESYHAENASFARWLTFHLAMSPAGARAWNSALGAVLLAVSLGVLWTAARREGPDSAGLALLVPVMLLSMPNSWANYQLLLLIPIAATLGAAAAAASRRDAVLLAGPAVLAVVWLGYHIDTTSYPLWLQLPAPLSAALHNQRVWVTLLLWLAMLRVVRARRPPPGEPAATVQGA